MTNSKPFRVKNRSSIGVDWGLAVQEVLGIRDRLGKPVDPGIRLAVIALRAAGFETAASCQGHLDHGEPFPWIDIGIRYLGMFAGSPNDHRADVISRRLRSIKVRNLRQEARLLLKLERFYLHRMTSLERRLVVVPIGIDGAFQLTVQGAHVQEMLPTPRRKARLAGFQSEFRDFGSFLRSNSPGLQLASGITQNRPYGIT